MKFTRETLLKILAKPAAVSKVKIDEQSFFIRKLSLKDQAELSKIDREDVIGHVAKLTIKALSDENGNQLLTDDDTEAVLAMPSGMLFQLAEQINAVNGFNKSVEDAEKN
ncbi:hypothetical protein SAMN02745664_12316 [Moraxella cuniculi DSM 21768]|uniref:Phage tail assembly chaperone protein, E, or 41 or 14 n=1 Tax=Moraxella cuniculi DSM 21768 TaxID=1122245 RepID=A0A1N7G469_9GAMM|nr:hypothetical protein [Moraxella cuniculi]OOS03270.1 hypothetical protein B0189_09715 [Moraxella cuniculi]SIS07387.1 hypothetical protein SAMN02745664_12316 [Moraxella cuniculi DSM 21768]